MDGTELKLTKAPIVEAVIDIDCDMPPTFNLAVLEGPSRDRYRDQYPKFRVQLFQETKIATKFSGTPQMSTQRGIQAYQFLHDDEKQLVQVRTQGFSFNRLAPYNSLDDYLLEIERTWRSFVELTSPVQIRAVQLRYINRILLPMMAGEVNFKDYFKNSPKLPVEEKMKLLGFFNQLIILETDTGNQATVVLTSQSPENDKLPIIFDNIVASKEHVVPEDWPRIRAKIQSLRSLKNHVFRDTLTLQCLNLFQ